MSSNISREDILRELELLPAWRLRNPSASMDAQTQHPEPAAITPVPVVIAPLIEPIEKAQLPQGDELSKEIALPVMREPLTPINPVFGMGDPAAEWLFVGEASGPEENLHSEPFIGQAGKLLDNMLAAMQLRRGQNVFMAHILKSEPPINRDPDSYAVLQCEPYLKDQIALVKPKMIVALGQYAAQCLLQSNAPIADLRGQVHQYQDVPVIATFHPADLLERPEDKAKAWSDLCFALKTIRS
jgi:uracil-DNA glycosylase family 4